MRKQKFKEITNDREHSKFLPDFPSVRQSCPRSACCQIHPFPSVSPSWPPPLILIVKVYNFYLATFFLKLLSGSEVSRSSENLFGLSRPSPAKFLHKKHKNNQLSLQSAPENKYITVVIDCWNWQIKS